MIGTISGEEQQLSQIRHVISYVHTWNNRDKCLAVIVRRERHSSRDNICTIVAKGMTNPEYQWTIVSTEHVISCSLIELIEQPSSCIYEQLSDYCSVNIHTVVSKLSDCSVTTDLRAAMFTYRTECVYQLMTSPKTLLQEDTLLHKCAQLIRT